MQIKYLNLVHGYLTAVYFTPKLCWRYTIFLHDGKPFQPNDSYSTPEKAYEIAKNIIYLVVACDRENTNLI